MGKSSSAEKLRRLQVVSGNGDGLRVRVDLHAGADLAQKARLVPRIHEFRREVRKRTTVSSVRSVAASRRVAEFFAPLTLTIPFGTCRPRTRADRLASGASAATAVAKI